MQFPIRRNEPSISTREMFRAPMVLTRSWNCNEARVDRREKRDVI